MLVLLLLSMTYAHTHTHVHNAHNTETDAQVDVTRRHQIVQEVLVNTVYLGGSPSLVEECGFGPGEAGYVKLQCVMSEHQADPLIAQYVGSATMKLLEAAGIDLATMQRAMTGE